MGICPSEPDDGGIGKAMRRKEEQDQAVKKLLLLGAGGSGKSTVFKQLKSIHKGAMTNQERRSYTSIVIGNVIDFMKTLVLESKRLSTVGDEKEGTGPMKECEFGAEMEEYVEVIEDQPDNFFPKVLEDEVADAIKSLWADRGIKQTFEERARFQLQDSASYFFDKRMNAISTRGYVPTEQDVLRCRVRTTGIVEQEFEVDGKAKFQVFDVGGQRNERRKWMHCFDNVTAVIFVASLSAYDQKLLEDETTNRMTEALDLFAQIADSSGQFGSEKGKKGNLVKWRQMGSHFVKQPIILFLNKSDLYAEKIEKVKLKKCKYFKDYRYPMFKKKAKKKTKSTDSTTMSKYDDGLKFIEHHFNLRNTHHNENGHKKQLYTHVTNATDQTIIKKVFTAVQHMILTTSLEEAGML